MRRLQDLAERVQMGPKLEEACTAALRGIFDCLDTNGKGALGRPELTRLVTAMGERMLRVAVWLCETLGEGFRVMHSILAMALSLHPTRYVRSQEGPQHGR